MNIKRILLVRTDRIGDVVLTTPIIKIIRSAYPNLHLGFLTTSFTEDLVKGNPDIDEVITMNRSQKKGIGFLTFIWKLRQKKFDVAIAFNPKIRIHWLLFLAGIPVRIGYRRKYGFLLTHALPDIKYEGKKSEAFYNEELLKYLNLPVQASRKLFLPQSISSQKQIELFLEKHQLRSKQFIVISVSASCPSKAWPRENFSELCHQLKRSFPFPILLIGKETDCGEIKKIFPETIFIGETLPLSNLIILLQQARLLITNDTGPMHIASAVNTPIVAIFGRTLPGLGPARWGPIQGNNIILHKDIGCHPCLAHQCQLEFDCLKAIKVNEVFHAVTKLIS